MNRFVTLTKTPLIATLFVALMASPASAAMINPTQNAVAEDDDARVAIQVRPNASSGGGFQYTRKAWIKFDLSGELPDPTKPATLTLYYKGPGTGNDDDENWVTALHGLDAGYSPDESSDGELGTDWTEADFTDDISSAWEEAPENDENDQIAFEAQTTKIGTFDVDTDGDDMTDDEKGKSFSVNIFKLDDFLQPDNTVTLMLGANATQNAGGDSRDFWTRSASNVDHDDDSGTPNTDARPTLEFTVIPEPTSALLLALAGLLALGRRRTS